MKIIFVIDSLCKGGKERRLVELLKGLHKEEIEFELILLSDQIDYDEVFQMRWKIHILKRKIKKDPTIYFKINSVIRKFNPSIINAWGIMPAVYCGPIAKLSGIKFVNSLIVNAPHKLRPRAIFFSKLSFLFSDIIIANSHAGLKSYGVRKEGIVIYNGYDFDRASNLVDADKVRRQLGVATRYVVGMIAGFRHHKDYATLIDAAKIILSFRDDISFILAGNGPLLEESKKQAGGNKKIIFTGLLTDVESVINICDIGLLSTYTEGISNSIMEFMAFSKPVIATEGGGTVEIVADGINGYLIPQKSPNIFAKKIIQLIDDQNLRILMGEQSKEIVKNKFSINNMIVQYINVFRKLNENQ